MLRRTVLRGLMLCCLIAALFAPRLETTYAATPSAIQGLKVSGNKIVNSAGQTVRLLGVNRSGAEFMCIQGYGIFDGPSDAASVAAMAAWKINTVRVPLNEDCWLGINGVNSAYGGSNYQQAIVDYVNLLNSYGLIAVVELHWSAPGTTPATGQNPMPDADHSPAFWQSVANTFKSNSSVIFDLFNEPYPDSNSDTTAAWTCWRDGGTCAGVSYQVAGMQTLVNTVRATGATNIIMLGGVQYSNALSQWLTYKPTDPQNNLVAAWHSYNFNICASSSCWDSKVAPVLAQVPVVAGEIGENDCAHWYIDQLMAWLDSHGAGYLGWTWNTWNCSSGPSLISDYSGTATAFGQGFKDHLAALSTTTPTPVTPTATATPVTPTATPTRTATPVPGTATPTRTATPVTPTATAAPTSTPGSGASCQVAYTVNQWSTGFTADVTVKNTGSTAINGWTVAWSFPGNQQVSNAWNTTLTQSGANVTAANAPYNASIASGATASFGFQASYSGSNSRPASFTLNGAACTIAP